MRSADNEEDALPTLRACAGKPMPYRTSAFRLSAMSRCLDSYTGKFNGAISQIR